MPRRFPTPLLAALVLAAVACGSGEEQPARRAAPPAGPPPPAAPEPDTPTRLTLAEAPPAPADLDRALVLALAPFEVSPEGRVLPKPLHARADYLIRRAGQWVLGSFEDPESNVFHKVMAYEPPVGGPGLLTLGGSAAAVKLWRLRDGKLVPETLWKKDFGGKFSRMRDGESADLDGDGDQDLAVATHDQGVVAVIRASVEGYVVEELDREKDTFVHEIEIGDLDQDGALEIYATPSEPNRLDGTPQAGKVTRYVPARDSGRELAANLGTRHAKEILVGDVDGDGVDELYVSVEGETEGPRGATQLKTPVEILRYDAGTPPDRGVVIARIRDRLCRFLTAGDVDGDGRREMVAAAFRSGLWLLRPGADPRQPWDVALIDADSSGFEHAAILTDLDGDGRDELYVASDDQGEVRRYVWLPDGRVGREVIHRVPVKGSAITWNIVPVPVSLLP